MIISGPDWEDTSADTVKKSGSMPPVIDIDTSVFDDAPFSRSFNGMLTEEELGESEDSRRCTILIDASFNVEQIKDIKEIVPEWDDDEVDEIVVLSPKLKNPMPNRLSTIMEDLQERDKRQNGIFSFADFEFLPPISRNPGQIVIQQRDTEQRYIVKRFKTTPSDAWPTELSVLESINDRGAPFLPQICWRVFEDSCFSVILDFHSGGSLCSYIETYDALSFQHCLAYAAELVEALSVIHAAGIQHRNITPDNIMIDDTGHLVLVGFDQAQLEVVRGRSQDEITSTAPTQYRRDYRAPELLLGWSHDFAVDCWSFGCVMYFMITGKHPFSSEDEVNKQKIIRGQLPSDIRVAPVVFDLLDGCLVPNPALRLTIAEIKTHEYFGSVNWSLVQEKNTTVPRISDEAKRTSVSSRASIFPQCSPRIADDSPTPSYSDNYSVQARQSVQDLLPSIFRTTCTTSDSHSLQDAKSTIGSSVSTHSINLEYLLPNPAPTYDSLRRRLDNEFTPALTPEERMARFWASLDEESDYFSPNPETCHYIPTRLQRRNKLRKKISSPSSPHLTSGSSLSLSLASTQRRISRLIKLSSPATLKNTATTTIRKHKSSSSFKLINDPVHLPRGIEQIGSGIGFTYQTPQAVTLPSPEITNHLNAKRKQIGLGLKLKISSIGRQRKWGSGLFSGRTSYDEGNPKIRSSVSGTETIVEPTRLSESSMRCARLEMVSGEMEGAADQDVFRYGSTWSLMPDLSNSGELTRMISGGVTGEEAMVSPVTETDTTVGNSPFTDLNLDESETLKGLLGRKSTLRLVL